MPSAPLPRAMKSCGKVLAFPRTRFALRTTLGVSMVNAVTGLGAASTCDPTASAASPGLLDSASSSGVPVSEAPALLPVPAWEPEEGPPLAADVPLEPEPENELLPEDPPDPPEPAAT